MKKFITICISCSLALAAGAMAQQDETSPAPKKKHQQGQEAAPPAKPQAERPAARPRAAKQAQPPANPQAEHPAARPHAGRKPKEPVAATDNATANEQGAVTRHPKAETPATEPAQANPDTNANPQAGHHKKGQAAHQEAAATANDTAKPAREKAGAQSTQTETVPQANQPNPGARKAKAQANKPDIQAIKAQHANFHAQPKPQQVPAVTFSQTRTINGSQQWQGEKYTVFRSYRPGMHDQGWYRSHFNRIELIGGGYYYFNAGYWYPAWGYEPSAQYYVYDGPIYAGRQAEPPDRVIADVQASLQAQGYYKGEVDGLLGPLTREALTGYQSDNGLYTTAAIDEPTLESLGI